MRPRLSAVYPILTEVLGGRGCAVFVEAGEDDVGQLADRVAAAWGGKEHAPVVHADALVEEGEWVVAAAWPARTPAPRPGDVLRRAAAGCAAFGAVLAETRTAALVPLPAAAESGHTFFLRLLLRRGRLAAISQPPATCYHPALAAAQGSVLARFEAALEKPAAAALTAFHGGSFTTDISLQLLPPAAGGRAAVLGDVEIFAVNTLSTRLTLFRAAEVPCEAADGEERTPIPGGKRVAALRSDAGGRKKARGEGGLASSSSLAQGLAAEDADTAKPPARDAAAGGECVAARHSDAGLKETRGGTFASSSSIAHGPAAEDAATASTGTTEYLVEMGEALSAKRGDCEGGRTPKEASSSSSSSEEEEEAATESDDASSADGETDVPLRLPAIRCRESLAGKCLAIGDVHGHLKQLKLLWKKLRAEVPGLRRMHVVFLGDYVDRGADVKETIEWLVRLEEARPVGKTHFVFGNHDFACASLLGLVGVPRGWDMRYQEAGYDGPPLWGRGEEAVARSLHLQGRRYFLPRSDHFSAKSTVASYAGRRSAYGDRKAFLASVPPEHLDFFRKLILAVEHEKYIFVHGGLQVMAAGTWADAPVDECLRRLRENDLTYPWMEPIQYRRWADAPTVEGKKTVSGHITRHAPRVGEHAIQIDTLGITGGLTAVLLPEETTLSTVSGIVHCL
ncbi:hypothetical protein DIPPA_07511 [Diplonema papillatum]|nr:hypothetical protein DIPPA_07511 [Diplonema papillatum]